MNSDTSTCEKCGVEYSIGDWPFCPHGKPRGGIIGDDIPGGIDIKHGICNPDGTPKRYYSKTEIRNAAYASGLTIAGETPNPNPRLVDKRAEAAEAKAKHRN